MGCPPAPVYKGARGRPAGLVLGAPIGSPTPTGSRTPTWNRRRGEESGGEEGKGGRRPPSLVLFGLGRGGARGHLFLLSSLLSFGPLWPNNPRGVPVTPRYSGKIADFTRNVSEVQT